MKSMWNAGGYKACPRAKQPGHLYNTTTEMNLKTVAITSLLVGTAFASVKDGAKTFNKELAGAIQTSYDAFLKNPQASTLRKDAYHHFDYKLMDAQKDAKPFCSLNCTDGDEDKFNTYVEQLRTDSPSKDAANLLDDQLKEKIGYIFKHVKLGLGVIEASGLETANADFELADFEKILGAQVARDAESINYLKKELEAFKLVLSSYESKTKNFKEIRSAMEALELVFRFDRKSDEFIRVVTEKLNSDQFNAKKLEQLSLFEALEKVKNHFRAAEEKLANAEKEKKDEERVLKVRNQAGVAEQSNILADALDEIKLDKLDSNISSVSKKMKILKKAEKKLVKEITERSLIAEALRKAHDKTSSPVTLGAFVAIAVLLAFGILIYKHRILTQKEAEEATE